MSAYSADYFSTPYSAAMEASATGARTTVATYDNYRDAERAVDFLSDKGYPVERAAIVGTGLKTVEQIAGRLTVGRAALLGAGQGATIGLLFGLLFGLFFNGTDFFGVVLYGLVAGTIFGATFGAIGQAMSGGRRDFASVQGMTAEKYELQVDHEVSAQAKQLLAELPAT
jgi:heat induced stress protein YflT